MISDKKESAAKYYLKGPADRPLGSVDKCVACGCDYVVNSARQNIVLIVPAGQVKAVVRPY